MEENGKNMYVSIYYCVYTYKTECVCVCVYVHVHAYSVVSNSFTTPWTVARQAPLSMEFSRQEDWSGVSFPTSGDLPYPGIEHASPVSPALQPDSLPLSLQGSPFISATVFFPNKVTF